MRDVLLVLTCFALTIVGCGEGHGHEGAQHADAHATASDENESAASVAAHTVTYETEDGVTVTADVHVTDESVGTPIVILLHQAGGDARGEYGPIIPRLVEHGINVIAVDLRSGGDRFGGVNRTMEGLEGREYSYCDAAPDVRGALELPARLGLEGPVYLWGSSYSAALAINVAAERPETDVIRVLAFSPASGGPMEACSPDENIATSGIPMILFRPEREMEHESVREQFELAENAGHETYVMPGGVHGSSMLVEGRTGGDPAEAWKRVFAFIDDPDSRH